MNAIVRPVSADGMCGFDEFGQFAVSWKEGDVTTMVLVHDVRRMTCQLCEHGWEPTSWSLRDQAHWDLIDARVHGSCLERHRGFVERAEFTRAIWNARFLHEGIRPVANGYWPPSYIAAHRPWYEADLSKHAATLVIGNRKRVTHIEVRVWDGATCDAKSAAEAFRAEDVTKEFGERRVLLHAWDRQKVAEYLTRLSTLLNDGLISPIAGAARREAAK